ncbi:MAG: hypothetical protein CVU36_11050 [Betaproteobacteria bacterium HGW-Betaproteobacteria-9]|nr:MAG: hypothetical protein CVU36_11050 [Betaproteobacteria bacterium HGW-Betaproteobacteria-9]
MRVNFEMFAGSGFRRFCLAFGAFVLLSLVFHWASLHFGFKRYLLSAEMFLAMTLFAVGLRWLGLTLFLVTACLEMTLGAITMFRLIDIGQVGDIGEYLLEARGSYLMLLLVLVAAAATGFWIAASNLKQLRGRWLLLLPLVLILAQWQLSFAKATFFSPPFAERGELFFGSSALFVHKVLEENRRRHVHLGADAEDAEYLPIADPSAASFIWGNQPTSPRILFIVAESWGVSKNPAVIRQQIAALTSSEHVQNLSLGSIDAVGTTAAGELRELCGRIPTRLNFRQMTAEAVGECMPAKLAKQGYRTVALHGAFGAMYRRTLWYPVIGFDDLVFREDLPFTGTQCHSFPGYCDRDLLGVVRQKLNQDKVFLYWLTLNSHIPYDRRDVANYREELCRAVFGATFNEQLCRYQNLHVQFFEHLAKLAEDEAMRGVEVVVVGDHPPIFNDSASRVRFEQEQVPMLHFTLQ